jgi:hypothetical protein
MNTDFFLYNGPLERGADLEFIELVGHAQQRTNSENCSLLLVTPGGNPDAAFKIGRYLQERYSQLSVVVPGLCKSAGTLLAMAAHELVYTPYGELGPLDVQMSKEDKLLGLESGLNTSEAFRALEQRATETFHKIWQDLLGMSNGVVSFQTASACATQMVGALFGPIFARIDAEEVGSRSRAMRIGEDYGMRLSLGSNNVKERALERLARSYPSHSFVIDFLEAQVLFNRVRMANEEEAQMIASLGLQARHPGNHIEFRELDLPQQPESSSDDKYEEKKVANGEDKGLGSAKAQGTAGGDGAVAAAAG